MSSARRATAEYNALIGKLAAIDPSVSKYIGRTQFSRWEKAAIKKKAIAAKIAPKTPPRIIRPDADYIASAKRLAPIAPSVRKYKRRRKLKPAQKAAITRKEKALQFAYNLHPLTPKQAKQLKGITYAPGVQAIQLANTGEQVKLHIVDKNLFATTNGRTWVYRRLEQLGEAALDEGYEPEEIQEMNIDTMAQAGREAFAPSIREAFPVEKIIRLAEHAFTKPHVHMIGLWTSRGRVGEGFRNLKEFTRWVYEDYSRYANVEKWVNGIAVLIADVGEEIPYSEWSKTSIREIRAARKERRKQRKQKG